jgi:diguanylate cyclase (GGDEF)-like protein
LTEAARRDSLTGLLNRAAFEERLNEEVLRAVRHGRELAVVMFDVDGFKSVNDRFGHQTGDRVLAGVAVALQSSFRQSDPVFRYGGDEFVALCPETSGAAIENVLQRLQERLQASNLPGITVSWGIASLPADAAKANELVKLADDRLYERKNLRRDRAAAAKS